MDVSVTAVFLSEVMGTLVLILLGTGVVANSVLTTTKGTGGGIHMITVGWGLAVFSGVWVAQKSGAHLNPAVTIGMIAGDQESFGGTAELPITLTNTLVYFGGELVGAFLGAVIAYLAYKRHYDAVEPGTDTVGLFATTPAIRSYGWNLVTEIIGTFVLVFVILAIAASPNDLGPLAVALLIVVIGSGLGGPTGYAINPTRDLGPRIAHALLPIANKSSSDWSYAWVPIVGPVIGGALGGVTAAALF